MKNYRTAYEIIRNSGLTGDGIADVQRQFEASHKLFDGDCACANCLNSGVVVKAVAIDRPYQSAHDDDHFRCGSCQLVFIVPVRNGSGTGTGDIDRQAFHRPTQAPA